MQAGEEPPPPPPTQVELADPTEGGTVKTLPSYHTSYVCGSRIFVKVDARFCQFRAFGVL